MNLTVSYSLQLQFPLVSKCGYIRKLVSESSDADLSVIELNEVPGGAEAFELAAKFCYGINFEITVDNIAILRCVAEYLEMTEDYAVGNLVGRTEAYVNEVALKSLAGAVSVLHMSENLLPTAERVKLVSRCIDTIAYIACKDSQFCMSSRAESVHEGAISSSVSHPKSIVGWWAEDLTVFRIDIFQRVLIAMMARGFKQYALGPILMLYAQKSLRGLVRSYPETVQIFHFMWLMWLRLNFRLCCRKYLEREGRKLSQDKSTRRGLYWKQ